MTLVSALLTLGLVIVVPLALPLHPDGRWKPAVLATSVLAALSLGYDQSTLAAVMAAPWLLLTAVLAGRAGWRWLGHDRTLTALPRLAALAYLVVGAGWLVLDRLAVEPLGVAPPFVVLTAVHFHYAGFTATLLAWLVWQRTAASAPRLSATMIVAVVTAPPIVALGFTFAGVLQVVGATVLTVGLFVLAWLTVRHVVAETDDRGAKALLVVSAIAVLVPMLLAVQWAVGWNFGTPALSIPAMARTHGVVNAVGFSLCGVAGWRRLVRSSHGNGPLLTVP